MSVVADIYINLHPEYDYASVILSSYFDLRDYVRLVDWLSWSPNRRELHIHANIGCGDTGGHLTRNRVAAFVQRMEMVGKFVLVRDSRHEADPWREFIYESLSDDELLNVECERCHTWDEMVWAQKDLEKWRSLLERMDENNEKLILERFSEATEQIELLKENEYKRKLAIKEIWKNHE